jgi:uncharacterized delta-60 repeat protein
MRSNTLLKTFSALQLLILVSTLHTSTPGTLDTLFGNEGITFTVVSIADSLHSAIIQTGDNILITGTTQTSAPSIFLAQYTSSGALDTTFNTGGSTPGSQTLLIGTQSEGHSLAIDGSNNILLAGYTCQNPTSMLLARYIGTGLSAGTLDTTFNSGGTIPGVQTLTIGDGSTANAIGIQSSGKIIIAGSSVNSGIPAFTIARFLSTGLLDTGSSFGTGGSGITITNIGNLAMIKAIAIDTSDRIITVGTVDNQITIARYTDSGVLDSSFGTGGILQPTISGASSSIPYAVTLDTSDNIVITGSVTVSGILKSLLIRVVGGSGPSPVPGTLDTTFNTTGYVIQSIGYKSEFYSGAIQSDGNIVAGGYALGPLGRQITLARYTNTGALDTTYGTNGISLTALGSNAAVHSVNLQSSGDGIAAGTIDDTFYVARFLE